MLPSLSLSVFLSLTSIQPYNSKATLLIAPTAYILAPLQAVALIQLGLFESALLLALSDGAEEGRVLTGTLRFAFLWLCWAAAGHV